MEKEQYLTSSLYTFENMREGNYLYVDKTEYLYKLVSQPQSMFFFSRPRRFGKSLMLSTLKAIFQGKKELFKGLYIESQSYDWKSYPVIHLDMGSIQASSSEDLEDDLINLVNNIASDNNISLLRSRSYARFEELVRKLYERDGKVVILIDEYDKPILNNILSPNIEQIQTLLKGFYSVLKTCEPYERFVFITGVGNFLKVSIFSDLNNLTDISMSDDFACMCGYTEEELEKYFHDRLERIASNKKSSYDELKKKIKKHYDGYKFSEKSENIYNPVSFTQFLENGGTFKNYWFATGTPSIVIKLLKEKFIDFEELLNEFQTEDIFTAFMLTDVSVVALMYQTGYLTIKQSKEINWQPVYKLGFPNNEVEEAFYRFLLSNLNNKNRVGDSLYLSLYDAITQNNIDKMMSIVDTYISGVPYGIQIEHEKYYQTIFYILFDFIGTFIQTEVQTSDGRIDAVIENGNNVYIFEFKLNKTEEIAFDQIIQKQYYKAYEHQGKQITLIGANFNSETHRITGWKKQNLSD